MKKILSLAMAAVMCLTMVACGGGSGSDVTADQGSASGSARSARPEEWHGSARTGRCECCFSAGIAEMSSVVVV